MSLSDDKYPESSKTEVLHGNDVIIKKTLETFSWMKASMEGSIDKDGPFLNVSHEPIWNGYIKLKKRGIKLRCVTEVTINNIQYCKKLMEVAEIRHLEGIRTNFAIADRKEVMLYGVSQEKDPLSQAIVTSVKGLVDAQQYMFENLWNKAIPAEHKIKEIEEGIKLDVIETITDPAKIQTLYLNILRSATTEIMLIIPTANAISHQAGIGVFNLLKEKIEEYDANKNVRIRLLSSQINNYYYNLRQQQYQKEQNTLLSFSLSSLPIELRNIEADLTTKSIIIIIDKKESLVIEIKDDTKDNFVDSVGFATYSNSRATVLSYISIFKSFWKQSELVKKLKESEELQKDFVHIAAHELKNPIQPILGLSSLLMKNIPDKKEDLINIIKIINRNAKKLIQLTSDILDVTKIETNNLKLNMEVFNLDDLISDIVKDYNNQADKYPLKLKYEFLYCKIIDDDNNIEPKIKEEPTKRGTKGSIYILADKTRITQVLFNLINNAIKFTTKGIVKITVELKYDDGKKVHIRIKDTGSGIDPSIIPNLFSKFATKSKGGTGLGLYISKNIIAAHGGKIWAENNTNGKGATFSFSLPLTIP